MPTKLIRGLYNISPQAQKAVVTIGNFDGVHLGHQALIAAVIKEAKARGVPSMVITFEPHAFEYFTKGNVTIARITRMREKFLVLKQCGVDYVLVLPFNQALAKLSAPQFVQIILQEALHCSSVIVGDDFRFGYKRQGDFTLLKQLGEQNGFSVGSLTTVKLIDERISSTRVRKALAAGELAHAEKMLGRPYRMQGRVSHGDKLGRELGYPTANIFLHRHLTPLTGIFTVYVHGITDRPLPGVANLGMRPTVNGTRCLLEVHLLDFNQDIYGRYVAIEFCTKLREEERYPNLALLTAQIAKDVQMARHYFEEKGVL